MLKRLTWSNVAAWSFFQCYRKWGLDHGVGHSLLLLYDVKVLNGQKSKDFNGLVHYPSNALYKFILN